MSEPTASGMTGAGWVFLIVAWSGVCATAIYCSLRLLGTRKPKQPDDADGNNV